MEQVLSRVMWPATFGYNIGLRGVRLMLDVWSERRALETLDSRLLADIGLSDVEARDEASRSLWDTPRNRTRAGH